VTSHAETYQWRDSSGRLVISDRPPPTSARDAKTIGTSAPPSTSAPQSADSQKTTAEKDMEFRKRQQESREKADKEAKDSAQAAQNRENCERARTHLQALESGRRMILPDGNGGETFLEDAQRGDEIERARNAINESCK
jgi:hypothetical protein